MQRIVKIAARLSLVWLVLLCLALALGGPQRPAPWTAITTVARQAAVDLPEVRRYAARDGMQLAYRPYSAGTSPTNGSVVLVPGSSADSTSMHAIAKEFAPAGYAAYTLDIRGHGDSGRKGHIDYIGQLEDDLEDFMLAVSPPRPVTLAGFSSGGGFVLRFAGSDRQHLFANCLLLAPYVSHEAPTYRPNSGGWVSIGIPRIIALSLLNTIGIRAFNELTVLRFGLPDAAKASLTSEYSFALFANFGPQRDYVANIRAVDLPCRLVAGKDDEAFNADRYADVFRLAGKNIPVTLVPGVGHLALISDPRALRATVAAVADMPTRKPPASSSPAPRY